MLLEEQLRRFSKDFREEVREDAMRLLAEEMPELTEELFALFETCGDRLRYERVYFPRRRFLAVLGLEALYELKEDGRVREDVLRKLEAVMEEICRERCWALPAHVDRKKEGWELTVDLFASETAQTLSELSDRLSGQLSGAVQDEICKQVERRVFLPFFETDNSYAWECGSNNWNAVCAGSIGSACLHLLGKESGSRADCLDEPGAADGPKETGGVKAGAGCLDGSGAAAPDDRLSRYLERLCHSLTCFIGGFADDGACLEGVGYYGYGMSYFTNFAQELYEYTGGKWDLFFEDPADWRFGGGALHVDSGSVAGEQAAAKKASVSCVSEEGGAGPFDTGWKEKLFRIAAFPAKCYFADGRAVSFSDSGSIAPFCVGTACVLGLHFPGAAFPDMRQAAGLHADSCYRFAPLKMILFYLEEYAQNCVRQEKGAEAGSFWVLPDAQWCIGNVLLRENVGAADGSDTKAGRSQCAASGNLEQQVSVPHTVGFACKGGNNGESHNHNDIGSFLYEVDGTVLLADLGSGEYTKDYFGERRYEILCNRSLGHNVPLIFGTEQQEGEEHACRHFEATQDGAVRMEIGGAYPEGLLERFERRFFFDKKSGGLMVEDCIKLAGKSLCGVEGAVDIADDGQSCREDEKGRMCADTAYGKEQAVLENLVTQIKPELTENGVRLRTPDVCGLLTVETLEKPEFRIEEREHKNHEGVSEKVYLIQWEVPVKDDQAECRFTVRCEWL